MTAKEFIETLNTIRQDYSGEIPKREIFSLAKEYEQTPVFEVVKLLKDKNDNHRLGAVSILDWKARNKKTSKEEKKDIYIAYIDNHKWIDNWSLVDRSAPYVVGGYLHNPDDKEVLFCIFRKPNNPKLGNQELKNVQRKFSTELA